MRKEEGTKTLVRMKKIVNVKDTRKTQRHGGFVWQLPAANVEGYLLFRDKVMVNYETCCEFISGTRRNFWLFQNFELFELVRSIFRHIREYLCINSNAGGTNTLRIQVLIKNLSKHFDWPTSKEIYQGQIPKFTPRIAPKSSFWQVQKVFNFKLPSYLLF